MRYSNYYSLITLILLLLSCKDGSVEVAEIKVKGDFRKIKVDAEKSSIVKLSKFATPSSIEIIPLEFNQKNILGSANKILFFDHKIYVADFSISKAIFVYDSSGHFLSKFGKAGRGPGEYLELWDFDVTSKGVELLADDRRILRFTHEGSFVNEIATRFYSFKFKILSDNKYVFYTKYRENTSFFKKSVHYNIILTDQKGTPEMFAFPYKSDGSGILFPLAASHFISSNNKTYFIPSVGDTIYGISDKMISPIVFYDFGEKSLPRDYQKNKISTEEATFKQIASATLLDFFYQKDSTYVCNYNYNNTICLYIYNASNGESLNIRGIIDDINYLPIQIPSSIDGDKIVSVFNSSNLIEMHDLLREHGKTDNEIKVFKNLMDQHTNGEFILVKYKLN
ncbi:6-bladed beta-propeller [Chitinophaga polysaccharea]|uniref:6-bladed beta-propeller n=1 Tax=Chitinophaga polysaccharea TaxID=1293035 RepID=UPI001156E2E6|nr:6-bladed beta-propeller [Chitinophaga polysaccharea]